MKRRLLLFTRPCSLPRGASVRRLMSGLSPFPSSAFAFGIGASCSGAIHRASVGWHNAFLYISAPGLVAAFARALPASMPGLRVATGGGGGRGKGGGGGGRDGRQRRSKEKEKIKKNENEAKTESRSLREAREGLRGVRAYEDYIDLMVQHRRTRYSVFGMSALHSSSIGGLLIWVPPTCSISPGSTRRAGARCRSCRVDLRGAR